MFEGIAAGFEKAVRRLTGRTRIEEADVAQFRKDLRRTLLEADVDYRLVKDFLARVEERVTAPPPSGLSKAQALLDAVLAELTETLGGAGGRSPAEWARPAKGPQAILLVGLNGAGKTTAAAKLVKLLGGPPEANLLVGADTVRPAAREQLATLAESVGARFFTLPDERDGVAIVKAARDEAERSGAARIVFDTAGGQAVDEELLREIERIAQAASADERILVLDAATGQSALAVAEAFAARVNLTGAFLSRADGDARGGAVLTLAARLGVPVRAMGTGEKPEEVEPFHPDRMARRILGMGDAVTLLEKAKSAAVDPEKAKATARRVARGEVDLEMFLEQMTQVRKMGGFGAMLSLLPGGGRLAGAASAAEDEVKRFEAIIHSMTPEERRNPDVIGPSRRLRIARGAGVDPAEVSALIKTFRQSRKMLKQGGFSRMLGGIG